MNSIALKSFVSLWQVSPEKTQLTGQTKPITFRHWKLKIVACKYNPLVSGQNLRVAVIGVGPKMLGSDGIGVLTRLIRSNLSPLMPVIGEGLLAAVTIGRVSLCSVIGGGPKLLGFDFSLFLILQREHRFIEMSCCQHSR